MSRPSGNSSYRRRVALLIGFVTFFSFTYFYEGGGWNQNSRFDLLRAVVERRTLQIDAYHENTGDKAHFQGHYYSDKAPGLVFLALPFALAARPVLRAAGIDPESPRGEIALSYAAGAGAVALPTALATVCLFFLGLRLGSSTTGAAFAAFATALGTPLWTYASLFWAHALVGACLTFAFAAALKLGEDHSLRTDFLWAVAVGLSAGWATVTEYPAAPASAILAVLALIQVWRRGKAARWRTAAGIAVGAVACVVVLMTYLYAAFDSFRPSYSYYDPNSFVLMQQRGYMGLTYPHVDALLKLLLGCRRGLFFAAPVALAAPIGLGLLWKEKTTRAAAIAACAIVAYYFLLNSSFYEWRAGLSYGPRYAGASILLLGVGLTAVWDRATLPWRRILVALAVVSVFFSVMVISTTSQLSVEDSCPMFHSSWQAFWSGQMAVNRGSMLTVAEARSSPGCGAFNLGQLLGLHGLYSLIPLWALWGIAAGFWVRMKPGRGRAE
jgi:4-amino-4-deoxy-L-arabinose transferase-like glycosyltransferase